MSLLQLKKKRNLFDILGIAGGKKSHRVVSRLKASMTVFIILIKTLSCDVQSQCSVISWWFSCRASGV